MFIKKPQLYTRKRNQRKPQEGRTDYLTFQNFTNFYFWTETITTVALPWRHSQWKWRRGQGIPDKHESGHSQPVPQWYEGN